MTVARLPHLLRSLDEFARGERGCYGNETGEIVFRFPEAERCPFEAFELSQGLLDAGAILVYGLREEGWLVLFVGFVMSPNSNHVCRTAPSAVFAAAGKLF